MLIANAFDKSLNGLINFKESATKGAAFMQLLLEKVPASKRVELSSDVESIISLTDQAMVGHTYARVPTEVKVFWHNLIIKHGIDEIFAGSLLLSTLIAKSPQRALVRSIPSEIVFDCNKQFERIIGAMKAEKYKQLNFDNDIFLKEIGLCRLEVLPCGAQLIDKNSGIPRRLAFGRGLGQMLSFAQIAILGKGRVTPYFEGHNHTPMIDEFSPEGFYRFYLLTAELLEKYSDYLGLIGGTWWYDPEAHKISPHLTYLRQVPEDGGAIFLKNGTSQADINNATANSAIRRKLYKEGKFMPTGYFMIWPRERLLTWAQNYKKLHLLNTNTTT